MTDSNKHEELLKHFTAHAGYKLDDYYGVTMMTVKKDRSFSIQLQYGYNKRAQNSSSLIVHGITKALDVYRILMNFAVQLPLQSKTPDLSFMEE